ncbi:helix-turn-helix transcriptional regulator [Actinomycetes bacterium KLBMP 9797]
MPTNLDPAVQRRRLMVALRELRMDKSLTQMQVAEALEWSHSKIVRIENGDVGISIVDLRALAELYGVTDKRQVDELLNMARQSRQQRFAAYIDLLGKEFSRYLGYEVSASFLRQYEPSIVPGLLQTEDYMYATARTFNPHESDETINRRVAARIERQKLLSREQFPEMHFILDEAVLRRHVGAESGNDRLMLGQIDYLKEVAARPRINIRVIRFSAGAHQGMRGPFLLLEFPDPKDDALLYMENSRGDLTTREDAAEITSYMEAFFAMEKAATHPDEFAAVADGILADMLGGGSVNA